MALLDDLLARLHTDPILSDVRVVESESVDDATFHFKVRAAVKSANLQIRFLSDETFTRYSFQLYSDHPLLRWDNTPHYPDLPNFPHHFHDAGGKIVSSPLTGNLMSDVEIVLAEVKQFIA
jgi:hypothetical protein